MARQSHMTDEIRKRNYEAHKQRMRERSRRETAAGRNIYPIPQVQNPEAKAKARESFRFFCEYYFPDLFSLAWSKDHLKAIAKIERAVKHGGKFAIAMPRGSGKTTLCEIACIWAALYGFHRFILLVGAESTMAGGMFESIKSEIQENERLYADFPEVCYPVEEIGGISNRASGQHCNGRRTQIKWNSSLLVFPDVTLDGLPESDLYPSSGVVIKYSGITGGIRGMKHKRNGKNERPTLVLVDDPQTDESARSPSQVADRLKLIVQTISNLAGAGQSCSVLVPCTVIVRNDVAEQLLNRKKHPEYQGERFKALEKWPSNMELWNRYAEMRAKDLQEDGDGSVATEFYRAHRKEMDAGAEVAWPERFNNDEISGLQFCMNKYFEDEASFASEFQQEPLVSDVFDDQLTPGHIVDKLNGRKRFSVPLQASTLTAFIDVQKEALYYVVCAWSRQFDGFLIDYGTFPKQGRRRFEAKTLDSKLEDMFPGMGMEGRIRRALDLLTTDILGREYEREDGVCVRISKCLIDANWGNSTDVVYNFCRESPFSAIVTPSHGKYFGAKSKPIAHQQRAIGETYGHNWYYPSNRKTRAVRHIVYDTNYWKTFLYNRIMTNKGDSGCFTIFGDDSREHELLIEHLTSEYWTPTYGNERMLYEWALRPKLTENHWFDGIVGASVAANEMGCSRPDFTTTQTYAPKRLSFAAAIQKAGVGEYERDEPDASQELERKRVSFQEMARRAMGG